MDSTCAYIWFSPVFGLKVTPLDNNQLVECSQTRFSPGRSEFCAASQVVLRKIIFSKEMSWHASMCADHGRNRKTENMFTHCTTRYSWVTRHKIWKRYIITSEDFTMDVWLFRFEVFTLRNTDYIVCIQLCKIPNYANAFSLSARTGATIAIPSGYTMLSFPPPPDLVIYWYLMNN